MRIDESVGYITDAINRLIKKHSKRIGKRCAEVWAFTNRHGSKHMYARYGKGQNSHICTVGWYHKNGKVYSTQIPHCDKWN